MQGKQPTKENTMIKLTDLSEASAALFTALAKDACNWSDQPMIGPDSNINTDLSQRGNITDLKRKGLICTVTEHRATFVCFTQEGAVLATEVAGRKVSAC